MQACLQEDFELGTRQNMSKKPFLKKNERITNVFRVAICFALPDAELLHAFHSRNSKNPETLLPGLFPDFYLQRRCQKARLLILNSITF